MFKPNRNRQLPFVLRRTRRCNSEDGFCVRSEIIREQGEVETPFDEGNLSGIAAGGCFGRFLRQFARLLVVGAVMRIGSAAVNAGNRSIIAVAESERQETVGVGGPCVAHRGAKDAVFVFDGDGIGRYGAFEDIEL